MELSENVIFYHNDLPNKCFDAFQSMKKSGECCDVRINFENSIIVAHRVILLAVFPGLKGLFKIKSAETNVKEITVENVEVGALESLIDFAYSYRLEITNNNAEGLLTAALFIKADKIVDACCEFLIKRINAQNAIKKLEFAENLHCTVLAESCRKFVLENFDEIATTEGFLEAPLSYIKTFISADDLITSCEENVFEAVMKWIEWCHVERKYDLPELLSLVRLTYISRDYLKDRVTTHENIRTSFVCRDLVDDAKDYHLLPKRRSEQCHIVTRPRKKMRLDPDKNDNHGDSTVAGIYAVSKRVIYDVHRLNVETGEWGRLPPFEQFHHTYAVTGSTSTIHFCDMEGLASHDVSCSGWSYNRKCFNDKVCASSAVIQNKLYICGGTDRKICCNSVLCYDLKNDRYDTEHPMSVCRILPGTVVLGQHLYVFGGLNPQRLSEHSVEKYDPCSKRWTTLAPMLFDRYGMGCAALNGRIYVGGGLSLPTKQYLNSVEVYDPVNNRWELISPMNTQRFNFSLVSDGKKLYAIGGCLGDQLLSTIEIYSPDTDVWEFGPDIDATQKYVQAVAVGYSI